MLHDPLHLARLVPDDSTVAIRIGDRSGDQSQVGVRVLGAFDQVAKQRRGDEGAVAVEDQDSSVEAGVGFHCAAHGVARATLVRLKYHFHPRAKPTEQLSLHVVAAVTQHHEATRSAGIESGLHDPGNERTSSDFVEDLGAATLHARAFSGREDDGAPAGR